MAFFPFDHEATNNETLELIPLDVRRKLDLVGVKLSLSTWKLFSIELRRELCEIDVEREITTFESRVIDASRRAGVEPTLLEPVSRPASWSTETARGRAIDALRLSDAVLAESLGAQRWAALPDALKFAIDRYREEGPTERWKSIVRQVKRLSGGH